MVLSFAGNYYGWLLSQCILKIDDDNVILFNYIMFMATYYKTEQTTAECNFVRNTYKAGLEMKLM